MEVAIQVQVEQLPEGVFLATSEEVPAVSYTHLDVYKRQDQRGSAP